jgi:hypothetical protein
VPLRTHINTTLLQRWLLFHEPSGKKGSDYAGRRAWVVHPLKLYVASNSANIESERMENDILCKWNPKEMNRSYTYIR